MSTPGRVPMLTTCCSSIRLHNRIACGMYWALAGDLQKRRAAGQHVDDELHHLTRAYECVADADSRAAYDASFGFDAQPLTVRQLPPIRRSLRGRLLRRPSQKPIDLYEVMGVARNVSPEHLQPAYRIMRDQYLRLRSGARQRQLIDTLDKAQRTPPPEARSDTTCTLRAHCLALWRSRTPRPNRPP